MFFVENVGMDTLVSMNTQQALSKKAAPLGGWKSKDSDNEEAGGQSSPLSEGEGCAGHSGVGGCGHPQELEERGVAGGCAHLPLSGNPYEPGPHTPVICA